MPVMNLRNVLKRHTLFTCPITITHTPIARFWCGTQIDKPTGRLTTSMDQKSLPNAYKFPTQVH